MIGFACALVLSLGCADAAASTPAPIIPIGSAQRLNPNRALAEINAFRRKHGLKPVVLDARLSRAAAAQARDQARRGAISHRGADGSKPAQRAARAGYNGRLAAENVASGQKSFSEAMRGWQRSANHRRNLLLPDAEAVGVGVSYRNGRPYYTLVLGAD